MLGKNNCKREDLTMFLKGLVGQVFGIWGKNVLKIFWWF